MLDGTPLLDIKPYLPQFDSFPDASEGWFAGQGDRRQAGQRGLSACSRILGAISAMARCSAGRQEAIGQPCLARHTICWSLDCIGRP